MSSPVPDEPPSTGHPAIDAALAALDLSGPAAGHAEAFSAVHAVLQDVLNPSTEPPAR